MLQTKGNFKTHIENILKEMEEELKHLKSIQNKEMKTMKAYALSGRCLSIRQLINPINGIDELYERFEVLTTEASSLINS